MQLWYKCQGWGESPLKEMSTIKKPTQLKELLSPAASQSLKLSASVRVCTKA